ncbi:Transposase-like protein [Methanosalsum zhilinae DSM 4017]|uniref:Transposase-like protein n=1 Tax=Methanosalsum zhilinae (strain DSM 4017 / NBRC 107636 / OCM 62 / WeN5) TaxID=679901 RepID=F7XNS2_METZD|nr:helix-turn-helix domain-containing protein [Methanosalsum zhilinae]AEH61273.1 Transposase-like protein [Methanosalsum zhilinae DSM 4017]
MTKPEQIPITRHLSPDDLDTILRRVSFIKLRYEGLSVEEAAKCVGISKVAGYGWQDNWNKEGYEGLRFKYAGGRPSKLSAEELVELTELLRQEEKWTTNDVHDLILENFNVEYSLKQVRVILNKLGLEKIDKRHYSLKD